MIRGTIYSADGQELAKTTTDENGDEVRTYPFGSLFAQVVGYTGKGNSGLESSYNYMLMESHTSKLKQVKNEFSDAKNPGDSLYTTLNTTLQQPRPMHWTDTAVQLSCWRQKRAVYLPM